MEERAGAVTMKGSPLTVLGPVRKPGEKLPDFALVDTNLQPVRAGDTAGKVRIFASVPSLDTPVCDRETRRFNEAASALGGVEVIVISTDLPFAQKRWCGAAGVDRVRPLSDYQTGSFGQAMGTLIKDLRLESRAIFVVDKSNTIRYAEYVPEIASEPNYERALEAAKQLL